MEGSLCVTATVAQCEGLNPAETMGVCLEADSPPVEPPVDYSLDPHIDCSLVVSSEWEDPAGLYLDF